MKRVVVVGLGIFGSQLARQLFEKGLEVIAIDKNRDVVHKIRDHSTKAVVADARFQWWGSRTAGGATS